MKISIIKSTIYLALILTSFKSYSQCKVENDPFTDSEIIKAKKLYLFGNIKSPSLFLSISKEKNEYYLVLNLKLDGEYNVLYEKGIGLHLIINGDKTELYSLEKSEPVSDIVGVSIKTNYKLKFNVSKSNLLKIEKGSLSAIKFKLDKEYIYPLKKSENKKLKKRLNCILK